MERREEGAGQQGQEDRGEGVAANADLLSSRVVGSPVKLLGLWREAAIKHIYGKSSS